jgi:hypothetical protein
MVLVFNFIQVVVKTRYAIPGQNISFFAEAVSDTTYMEYTGTVTNITAYGSDNGADSVALSGVTAVWESNMGMFRITIPRESCPDSGHMFYGVIDWNAIIDVKFEFYMIDTVASYADIIGLAQDIADLSTSLTVTDTRVIAIQAKTDNLPDSIWTASNRTLSTAPATAADISSAINSYDPPTYAEMTAAFTQIKGGGWTNETLVAIKAGQLTAAQVNAECDQAISDGAIPAAVWSNTQRTLTASPPGTALSSDLDDISSDLSTIDTRIINLNGNGWTNETLVAIKAGQLTAAQVNAECDQALSDYDAPTKTEMDNAHALLATASGQNTAITAINAIKNKTDTIDWTQIEKILIMSIGNHTGLVEGSGSPTVTLVGVGTAVWTVDIDGNRSLTSITLT